MDTRPHGFFLFGWGNEAGNGGEVVLWWIDIVVLNHILTMPFFGEGDWTREDSHYAMVTTISGDAIGNPVESK